MAELQICMLGSFQASWDFVPLPASAWRGPFAARLLKLVLMRRPDPVPAAEAVRLAGGGMGQSDLAPAIEQVRRALEPGATLLVDGQGRISFQPGRSCWIDLDALKGHYRAGVAAMARGEILPAILAFQEADGLYQGDLLEEMQEPWVQEPRQELQRIYTEILDRLAEGHSVLARYQDAVGFCHKALAHDPLRESTYQRMMVYYYYLGDLAGAHEAFAACREALENAGRRPGSETVDLWERLSRCEMPIPPGSAAAASGPQPGKPGKPKEET